VDTERTPEPREDDVAVSTRSTSRTGERRPPAPRPAHPRRSDAGTVELEKAEPAAPAEPEETAEPDAGDTLVTTMPAGPTDPRPTIGLPPIPTNIYRARRPGVAIMLVVPAVVAGLLLVRALAIAAFGTPFHAGGVIASCLGLASLPLLVSGLYGLITGAAHGAEQWGFRVWARPPLAYLIVGISFVVAAGLAIGGR
jgi:hypothetical protein